MKIEKVNENQFRCTLTREDLAQRQIRLSELAYGSDKARELFRDIVSQANYEFGFEVNDVPLMVEAIPTSQDSIVLQVTKTDYPEELDTRFAKFTDADPQMYDLPESQQEESKQGAADILELFRHMKDEGKKNLAKSKLAGAAESKTEESTEEPEKAQKAMPENSDLIRMFAFPSIDNVLALSRVLADFYHGSNSLYKDAQENYFYLVLHKGDHTPQDFNRVCNMTSEFGSMQNYNSAIGAHLKEHQRALLLEDALATLARL